MKQAAKNIKKAQAKLNIDYYKWHAQQSPFKFGHAESFGFKTLTENGIKGIILNDGPYVVTKLISMKGLCPLTTEDDKLHKVSLWPSLSVLLNALWAKYLYHSFSLMTVHITAPFFAFLFAKKFVVQLLASWFWITKWLAWSQKFLFLSGLLLNKQCKHDESRCFWFQYSLAPFSKMTLALSVLQIHTTVMPKTKVAILIDTYWFLDMIHSCLRQETL